jgi:hypothetical protein
VSTKNKKDCAALNCLKAAQPVFPFSDHRSNQMGKRQFRMYTQELPICIPEICVAVYAFRSALDLFSQPIRISFGEHGPFGFFVVAFPPPPVTFPATRLKSEDLSDWRILQG